MTSDQEIIQRLDRIERMLSILLPTNDSEIDAEIEIAMVKASGQDLLAYLKNRKRGRECGRPGNRG